MYTSFSYQDHSEKNTVTTPNNNDISRRDVIKATGGLAAASVFAGVAIPAVHAAEKNTIQVALVGCGGRGTGAAINALSTQQGPVELVAMADLFPDKMARSVRSIKRRNPKQFKVTEEKQFLGFDAYKKAIDCLNPGDVVIFATPPAFRWVHFTYAIKKGVNVFMEKPVTVDGPTSKRMFALGEEAAKKNLKVGVGLMCRHCEARGELYKRIKDGELGQIIALQAYRQQGPIGSCFTQPRPKNSEYTELQYQIRRFHSFLWASGGSFSDFFIHNIDECCWMKDDWPVEARASGGRHYRGNAIDQNFDSYSVEYTFADGTKLFLEGRNMENCEQRFASYAHGSKGAAIISTQSHIPAKSRIFKGQDITNKSDVIWSAKREEPNPYQVEWEDLMAAIRSDAKYNEVERGVKASLVTSMGRMAAHTGQTIKYEQILNSDHEFAPKLDELTMESAAPLQSGKDGKYPIPQPGITTEREYIV